MHQVFKKVAAIGFLAFLGLWAVGFVLAWSQPYPPPPPLHLGSAEEIYAPRQQIANNLKQLGLALTPLPLVLDKPEVEQIRVFEKNAQLALGTAAFEADEGAIRAAIATHQAVVFNEKKSGIAPNRRITLEIGIHPDRFDDLVEELRQVGQLQSISVQQRDRTDEFRRLHAQRKSVQQYLEAVRKLRGGKVASLEDELKLEQKIQDIEKELQVLAVQLGDLLGKESFYHVYVTLSEYQPGSSLDRTFSLPRRVGNAFLWALPWWLALALAAGLVAGAVVSVRVLWRPGSADR
jgi:hypothetical protein